MLNFLLKNKLIKNPEISYLLSGYRYIALLITSFFYIAGPPTSSIYLKLGVCFCLFVEAYIFIKVYNAENGSNKGKKSLILVETIGLAFVLIVTGGMASPFLWYAINPILLSASLLPAYFCWVMLVSFTASVFLADRLNLYRLQVSTQPWPSYSFVLIFALITLVAQLYNHFFRNMLQQSALLEKQLQHIKSLYQAAEAFSLNTDPNEVVSLFASYAKILTEATKVIIWVDVAQGLKSSQKKHYYAVRGPRKILLEEVWYPYLQQTFSEMQVVPETNIKQFIIQEEKAGSLITVPISSKSQYFGIFSLLFVRSPQTIDEVEQTIKFLADLCAVALEKYALESIAEEYLLEEEKDRIAGEIHDNVSQNLFGLVYGMDQLIKEGAFDERVLQQLKLFQKTAQQSLKDLRASIYSMSSVKNLEEPLVENIRQYLSDFEQLNHIKIDFIYPDKFNFPASHVRKSLYRIIREATGNAFRHGNCDRIEVAIKSNDHRILLSVSDNGCGFNIAAKTGAIGLGLINMRELTRSVGGEFTIDSTPGKGTHILCEFPLDNIRKELLTG